MKRYQAWVAPDGQRWMTFEYRSRRNLMQIVAEQRLDLPDAIFLGDFTAKTWEAAKQKGVDLAVAWRVANGKVELGENA